MADSKSFYKVDLRARFVSFSIESIKLLKTLPYRKEYEVFRKQLSKSATSIGANFVEAQSTTYKEFAQKVRISLREANESKYWLEIISKLDIVNKNDILKLIKEVDEITKILGSIVSKTDKNIKNKQSNK